MPSFVISEKPLGYFAGRRNEQGVFTLISGAIDVHLPAGKGIGEATQRVEPIPGTADEQRRIVLPINNDPTRTEAWINTVYLEFTPEASEIRAITSVQDGEDEKGTITVTYEDVDNMD